MVEENAVDRPQEGVTAGNDTQHGELVRANLDHLSKKKLLLSNRQTARIASM
ncbi:MAG: hypothetical protein JO110_06565 [Acetobacteraceae bacterium]|nr:hypothetical protein [Acetobacteraceae bacterium]